MRVGVGMDASCEIETIISFEGTFFGGWHVA